MSASASMDMMYLASKRTLLSAPGIKMDDIYYTPMNSTVEMSEATYNLGRLTISLSQLSFNSQSQVIIPNQSLLSTCFLHLELPPVIANQTLCRGWGYACINNINFLFGSSNVSQLQINGQTLLQTVMMECESAEKRTEIFRLGGDEWLVPSPAGTNVMADILLPLPWSSACGPHTKKPFDTTLLNNPITVQIQFNQASSIFGGTGAMPSAFSIGTFIPRQGDLKYRDQSLQMRLMQHPELEYSYPFIHHQNFIPSQFTGITAGNGQVSITLQSIINADLVAMTVGVVQQQYLAPASQSSPSLFNYDPITNISLQFNGLVMFNSPGQLWKMTNMNSEVGAGYFFNSVINPGNTAPFTSNPVDTYILTIDFSRLRSLCFEGMLANVWRLPNNVLTLNFNTSTTNTYVMFVTYHYNGVAEVQHGQTNIYFD